MFHLLERYPHGCDYDQVFSNTDITKLHFAMCLSASSLCGCLCFHVYATLTAGTDSGNLCKHGYPGRYLRCTYLSSTLQTVLANKQSARLHVLPNGRGVKSEIDVSCLQVSIPFSPPITCLPRQPRESRLLPTVLFIVPFVSLQPCRPPLVDISRTLADAQPILTICITCAPASPQHHPASDCG
jgi:hypothetical protein